MAIPKPSKLHKAFLSVLVRCRHRVILPHELILSFGMRKFIVLIIDNRLPFPVFRRDLEKYIYQAEWPSDDLSNSAFPPPQAPNENYRDHKWKEIVGVHTEGSGTSGISSRDQPSRRDTGDRSFQEWKPQQQASMTRPMSDAPGVMKIISNNARPVSLAFGASSKGLSDAARQVKNYLYSSPYS